MHDRASDLTEQALIDYCRERLARYKCPTSVEWIDALPRNPSGKILKKDLREPYWVGRTAGSPKPPTCLLQIARGVI